MSWLSVNNTERNYWDEETETMPREQLLDLQLSKARTQIKYNYENSLFYKNKFDSVGLEPGDIKTWDDFRKIPFMDKNEHRAAIQESNRRFGEPFSMLSCAPLEKIVRISATSGTTGVPTFYTHTKNDIKVINKLHARKYWRIGLRPHHTVLFAFGLSLFVGGQPVVQALSDYGFLVVPVGAEGRSQRILENANLTKPQVLFCTPSLAEYLIEQSEKILKKPIKELGIKYLMCAGEPGVGIPELKRYVENAYGARMFDMQGSGHPFQAISCPGDEYKGMHLVGEDYCISELIDSSTGKNIEITDGAIGELVLTYLDWEGTPFLRYRLGDRVQVFTEPCSCGWPGIRVKLLGRTDDMLIVKGVNLYPAAIKNALLEFMPRVTGNFKIMLDQPGPRVTPPLKLTIEHGSDIGTLELPALSKEIEQFMSSSLKINPEITFVPAGSLGRAEHKTRYIEINQ